MRVITFVPLFIIVYKYTYTLMLNYWLKLDVADPACVPIIYPSAYPRPSTFLAGCHQSNLCAYHLFIDTSKTRYISSWISLIKVMRLPSICKYIQDQGHFQSDVANLTCTPTIYPSIYPTPGTFPGRRRQSNLCTYHLSISILKTRYISGWISLIQRICLPSIHQYIQDQIHFPLDTADPSCAPTIYIPIHTRVDKFAFRCHWSNLLACHL